MHRCIDWNPEPVRFAVFELLYLVSTFKTLHSYLMWNRSSVWVTRSCTLHFVWCWNIERLEADEAEGNFQKENVAWLLGPAVVCNLFLARVQPLCMHPPPHFKLSLNHQVNDQMDKLTVKTGNHCCAALCGFTSAVTYCISALTPTSPKIRGVPPMGRQQLSCCP